MYGYIYKTTNKINGKIYIGQKKSTVFLGNQYLGSGRYLRNAINKYGQDNFCVELIKWCETKQILDEAEKYYIKSYHATDHTVGYNITLGAAGGDTFSNLSLKEKQLRRQILRQSPIKPRKTKGLYVWYNNGIKSKLFLKTEIIPPGWVKGTGFSYPAWNKGLTKDTDKRVKQYTKKLCAYNKKHPRRGFKLSEQHKQALSKNTIGKIAVFNGIKNTWLPANKVLPTGWSVGWKNLDGTPYTYKIKTRHCSKEYLHKIRSINHNPNSIKVHCIENNKTYTSLGEAERILKISPYLIQQSIRTGQTKNGFTFILVK